MPIKKSYSLKIEFVVDFLAGSCYNYGMCLIVKEKDVNKGLKIAKARFDALQKMQKLKKHNKEKLSIRRIKMSAIEKLENHQVKLTLTINPTLFEKGLNAAYLKNRSKFHLQGFRKGKAPRKLIETAYGKNVFYEDAVNEVIQGIYEESIKEHDLYVVSKPELAIEEIGEGGAVLSATVYVKPEYEIQDYENISYKPIDVLIEEAEIEAEIAKDREKNARIITIDNRPVEMGDIADINFEGFIEDIPFEGGKGENFELEIGSHSFIDNFEEQITGKNIDDEFDVFVKFPSEYRAEQLAGKDARFRVKINGIKFKELPETDDDFAQEVSEFDTLQEYKDDIRTRLNTQKEIEAERDIKIEILQGLVERINMDNIPADMINNEINQMISNMANRVQSQGGISFQEYLASMNVNLQDIRMAHFEQAQSNVKTRLALEAVVRKENIEITDEELNDEIKQVAAMYGYSEDIEKFTELIGEAAQDELKNDIKSRKAYDLIREKALAIRE